MGAYRGRHRRHTDPPELPTEGLRGLADLIEVVDDDSGE